MKSLYFLFALVGLAFSEDVDERCTGFPDPGFCLASIKRFYYNEESNVCEEFIWGGCGGNKNRHITKASCEKICVQQSAPSGVADCALEPETGPCRAYIPSFYYNSSSGECKKFIYGGCDGNANRFSTKEKCHNVCASKQKSNVEDCHLEQETGPCRAAFPRYYFDLMSGECKEFIYGGCGGNGNNFESLEDCRNTCVGWDW